MMALDIQQRYPDGTVAAINQKNEPYLFDPFHSVWKRMGTTSPSFDRITVGASDQIWGLSNKKIFVFHHGEWVEQPAEPLLHVSAGADGTVLGVPVSDRLKQDYSPAFPLYRS